MITSAFHSCLHISNRQMGGKKQSKRRRLVLLPWVALHLWHDVFVHVYVCPLCQSFPTIVRTHITRRLCLAAAAVLLNVAWLFVFICHETPGTEGSRLTDQMGEVVRRRGVPLMPSFPKLLSLTHVSKI